MQTLTKDEALDLYAKAEVTMLEVGWELDDWARSLHLQDSGPELTQREVELDHA